MKGVVFTEFLEFVTAAHGPDCVDDMIEASGVPNGGAYTSVGTYDFREMQALVVALSRQTNAPVPALLSGFGFYLCGRFVDRFPDFFTEQQSLFDFLERVDNHIHVEVHKLYPDAELPKFKINARQEDRLELDYQSCRPLESLAEGMILAAAQYFAQPVRLDKTRMGQSGDPFVRFTIQHAAAA